MNIVYSVNDIIERLKLVIKLSGQSQRGFAIQVGITPSGLNGILKGRVNGVSVPLLKNIENRYNINQTWLETGHGAMYVKKFFIENQVEIRFVTRFRSLSEEQKKSIMLTANAFYQLNLYENKDGFKVAEQSSEYEPNSVEDPKK